MLPHQNYLYSSSEVHNPRKPLNSEFHSDENKTTRENIEIYRQQRMLKRQEPGEDEEGYDSDEAAFRENKQQTDRKEDNKDAEELSDDSRPSGRPLNLEKHRDFVFKDVLYTQYEKVHRVKSKWKCNFKDAVLLLNGKEYVFDRIVAELERDW